MVFLELRWDSRVTTGNSGFLLCWPRKSNLPFELPGRAGDWAPFTEGQTRPHLGLYPGLNVPLHRRQGFGVAFHTHPGSQASSRGEAMDSALLSSRTGMSWSPLSGLKGVKPPLVFGGRTRDCSPGNAGNEGPRLPMTGASRRFSRAVALVWGFSRSKTGSSVSLSRGARAVRSLCTW